MKDSSSLSLETFFSTITDLVENFEQGDVMMLLEILSCLKNVPTELEENKESKLIYNNLLALADAEMKNSSDNFIASFAKDLDLLSEVIKNKGKLKSCQKKQTQNDLQELEQNSDSIDNEQVKLFISDCDDRLSRAQDLILILEQEHNNFEAIKELFRIFHTIKGECGFLKFSTLGNLSHSIENIFDLLRSQKLVVSQDIINLLLAGLDLVQNQIEELSTGSLSEQQKSEVVNYTNSIIEYTQNTDSDSNKKEVLVETKVNEKASKQLLKNIDKNGLSKPAKDFKNEALIKVKASNINYLVDMIGELLICLGQMKENTEGLPQVRKIAKVLQYAGMQLRTENMHTLFSTVRRIIRDTSQKVGKNIKASFTGEDLEIDRNLIDLLEEPLMHIIRNAIDHGIEPREKRIAVGKSEEGQVNIIAEQRGNNIVISIADDGCGLDKDRIRKKAVEKGLVTLETAELMSDSAIYNLIFVSGFSTNESVSLVSGRGVGMDIVQEMVHKAKGYIHTESIFGKGTKFSLYFPLCTAIIDGLWVRAGKNIFIIPVNSVIESFRIEKEQIYQISSDKSVLNIRGEILPVISIANIFDISLTGGEIIATIIENAEKEKIILLSEEILAKREVVIKNLSPCFKNYKGINSGTVLPGGSIGLVIDVEQILELGKQNKITITEADCVKIE